MKAQILSTLCAAILLGGSGIVGHSSGSGLQSELSGVSDEEAYRVLLNLHPGFGVLTHQELSEVAAVTCVLAEDTGLEELADLLERALDEIRPDLYVREGGMGALIAYAAVTECDDQLDYVQRAIGG